MMLTKMNAIIFGSPPTLLLSLPLPLLLLLLLLPVIVAVCSIFKDNIIAKRSSQDQKIYFLFFLHSRLKKKRKQVEEETLKVGKYFAFSFYGCFKLWT